LLAGLSNLAHIPIPGATMKSLFRSLPLILLLSACGGDKVPDIQNNVKQLQVSFNDNINGWKTGFSDYSANDTDYEFSSGQIELPAPLNTPVLESNPPVYPKGFFLNSYNHSDDMFMFITKYYDGLEANRLYDFDFELTFATNAQKNCVGIGGAPGESVTIKAGASKIEPKPVNDGNSHYSLNIDKGNQTLGGTDAIVLGNFANDRECGSADTSYMKKTLRSERQRFSAYTDDKGGVWILFGTDSGFEGVTRIYFMSAKIWAIQH
jgi:hypothetical protein